MSIFVVWFKFPIIIILVVRKQPISVLMRQIALSCNVRKCPVCKDWRQGFPKSKGRQRSSEAQITAWCSGVTRWKVSFLSRGAYGWVNRSHRVLAECDWFKSNVEGPGTLGKLHVSIWWEVEEANHVVSILIEWRFQFMMAAAMPGSSHNGYYLNPFSSRLGKLRPSFCMRELYYMWYSHCHGSKRICPFRMWTGMETKTEM